MLAGYAAFPLWKAWKRSHENREVDIPKIPLSQRAYDDYDDYMYNLYHELAAAEAKKDWEFWGEIEKVLGRFFLVPAFVYSSLFPVIAPFFGFVFAGVAEYTEYRKEDGDNERGHIFRAGVALVTAGVAHSVAILGLPHVWNSLSSML